MPSQVRTLRSEGGISQLVRKQGWGIPAPPDSERGGDDVVSLTWTERVAMFVINPQEASLTDVSRMAGELKELNKKVGRVRVKLRYAMVNSEPLRGMAIDEALRELEEP